MTVAILDYGAGNVASVARALRHLGAGTIVTSRATDIGAARAIAVPGVGHFSRTAAIGPEAREALRDAAGRGVPVLGICLGLHWMYDGSDEAPGIEGLGVLAGRCESLGQESGIKVPHVGWNTLECAGVRSRLLDGLADHPFAYFCHSYVAPVSDVETAWCRHGARFPAVVERGSIFGVQFHPEKSGDTGLTILRNFLRIAEGSR